MEITDIKQQIERLKNFGFQFFEPIRLHVPNSGQSLRSVMEYLIAKEAKELVWLPEYNQVAAWLHNNEGRRFTRYFRQTRSRTWN